MGELLLTLILLEELRTIKSIKSVWPLSWKEKTTIMGVINVTPDSFSDGGLCFSPELALEKATSHILNGAHVLDLGAQSTRPGALEVGYKEELKRLIPVVKLIREKYPNVLISVDTFEPSIFFPFSAALGVAFSANCFEVFPC